MTKAFVATARKATTWVDPPTVYEPSVEYFHEHFDEMDPNRPHRFSLEPEGLVPMAALATESATLSGRLINVAGNVYGPPTVVMPVTEEIGSYAVAVRDKKAAPDSLVLCRMPFKRPLPFDDGDRVTLRGLVLADGLITDPRNGRMRKLVYMACTSMVRSVNVSLTTPRGHRKDTPEVEING